MIINSVTSPLNIVFQARKDNNNNDITQQGLQEAKNLMDQYGSSKKIVVFGDHAVALDQQTFSELEAKFGKAKELENGAVALNKEGSNYVANWYNMVMIDLGVDAADKNRDGAITNREFQNVRGMLDVDRSGHFFLGLPSAGEIPNDDAVYKTTQSMLNGVIERDKDKDGVVTTSEVKQGSAQFAPLDADMYRNYVMAARGQNPDGSMIMTAMGDIQLPGLTPADSKNQQSASLQQKLQSLDAKIEQLRKQGGVENEQQIKELMATRQTLVVQLQQSGASPSVDVKA